MRKVIVTPTFKSHGEAYKAKFHQWGAEYEEFDTGPGNYTVAIVELEDGTIKTIPPNWVKFED